MSSNPAGEGDASDVSGPRAFVLQRDEDETGVSGTGVVAEGVLFSDGTVSLRWTSAWPTSVVFHDKGMESVEAVHGHGGKTRVVFSDGEPEVELLFGATARTDTTACPRCGGVGTVKV